MPKDNYRLVYNGNRMVLRKVGGAIQKPQAKPIIVPPPVPQTPLEIQVKPPITEKEDTKARRARIAADLRKAFS